MQSARNARPRNVRTTERVQPKRMRLRMLIDGSSSMPDTNFFPAGDWRNSASSGAELKRSMSFVCISACIFARACRDREFTKTIHDTMMKNATPRMMGMNTPMTPTMFDLLGRIYDGGGGRV